MRVELATFVVVVGVMGGAAGATAAVDREQPAKPCSPPEVGALVVRFVDAFNAGDTRELGRIWAAKPYFRWYSTDAPGRRVLPIAADRATLLPYFARRHAQDERLALLSLRVNGNTPATGRGWKTYGNFEFRLVREAADLPATPYQGKGALHCYRSRPDQLIVWSMAPDA
jgi:hypothetical protein